MFHHFNKKMMKRVSRCNVVLNMFPHIYATRIQRFWRSTRCMWCGISAIQRKEFCLSCYYHNKYSDECIGCIEGRH